MKQTTEQQQNKNKDSGEEKGTLSTIFFKSKPKGWGKHFYKLGFTSEKNPQLDDTKMRRATCKVDTITKYFVL